MDFKTKKEEIEKKYHDIIVLIANTNGVDMGVAYDMFNSNICHDGTYQYFNVEEAKKDFEELKKIAEGEM